MEQPHQQLGAAGVSLAPSAAHSSRIPAPSRTSRVLRVVLKTVVVSALLYGGYKAARGVYTRLARIAAV